MRLLITALALTAGLSFANAQKVKEEEVPSAVKDAFRKQYPDEKTARWEKDGNNYEAEFRKDMKENSATFSSSGKLIESEVEIDEKDLPKAVTDYISRNLDDKRVKDAYKVTDADGKTMYKAEVGDMDYIFSSEGSFIRKEMTEEERDRSMDRDSDKKKDRDMDMKHKEHDDKDMDND